jgi:hypothetical protein
MSRKQIIIQFTIIALLTIAFVTAVTQFKDIRMKDLFNGIFILTLYIVLIVIYLMRLVLPVIGVYAIYKLLRERANKKTVNEINPASTLHPLR